MEDAKPVDIDSTIVKMEAEQSSNVGLYVPGKDRVLFRRPEKSRLGLDTLALAKRGAAKVDGALKASKVVTPVAQDSTTINNGERQCSIWRYRDTSSTVSSHLENNVNGDTERNDRSSRDGPKSESRTPRHSGKYDRDGEDDKLRSHERYDRDGDDYKERSRGRYDNDGGDDKERKRGAERGRHERDYGGGRQTTWKKEKCI